MARIIGRPSARAAAAVDATALAAFVVVGVVQHDEGLAVAGLVRTGVWFENDDDLPPVG